MHLFKYKRLPSSIVSSLSSGFLLYPNPASDYIEISCPPSREGAGALSVLIFDLLGIEFTSPSLRDTPPSQGGEKVRIDVSHLSPGVYFVRAGNIVQKFVKL
jgi:hypothetical protein